LDKVQVPQDREALDQRFTKQNKESKTAQEPFAVQLSQEETDEIKQRLQADAIKRNRIKANRLKQQKDSALLETKNLFSENFYIHTNRKDESVFIFDDKRSFPRKLEENHQILIW
jgi:hypothetical protein